MRLGGVVRLGGLAKPAGKGKGLRKVTAGLALAASLSVAACAIDQPNGARAASTGGTPAAGLASSGRENEYEQWGFHEEYGEFVAAPEELATASVNEIVKSIRLNGQATRLGEAVYARHCAQCHGLDLKGLPGRHVPDLTDEIWRFSGDDLESVGANMLPADVEWTVRYGVRSGHPYSRGNDSGMLALDPAFRSEKDRADFGSDAFLSAAEIEDMVEYVLQLSGQPHDAAAARRAAPLFQDNAKGNCFDCHGMDGTGLAIFGSTNLTRKDQYLYGSDRAAIRESIIKGRYSVMPGFEGVLEEEQLKAVSVYVHWGAAK